MNLKLTIEGDASALARVLAFVGAGDGAVAAPNLAPVGQMPTIPPMPSGDADDDDNGPPAVVAAGTVDKDGLPWDERIHAKSKATNADGTWRKRRNVDDATVAMVETQLRAGSPAPFVPAAPVTPPLPPMAVPPVPMTVAPVAPPMPIPDAPGTAPAMPPMPPVPQVAPIAPPMPAAPAASPVVDQAAPMDMATFMQHISVKMTEKDGAGAPLVHMEYLQGLATQIATAFNSPVASITDIGTNPNMITYAAQLMQRDGKW